MGLIGNGEDMREGGREGGREQKWELDGEQGGYQATAHNIHVHKCTVSLSQSADRYAHTQHTLGQTHHTRAHTHTTRKGFSG